MVWAPSNFFHKDSVKTDKQTRDSSREEGEKVTAIREIFGVRHGQHMFKTCKKLSEIQTGF